MKHLRIHTAQQRAKINKMIMSATGDVAIIAISATERPLLEEGGGGSVLGNVVTVNINV
jgi:hypothetical protein